MISFKAFADEFVKIAWEDKIPGGLADRKKPSEFDKKELKDGVKDEASEHSKGNKDVAKEIAMDHLSKDPHYYSKMKKLEAKEKNANGDMIQYFTDHPEKLKEKQERDAKKKRKFITDPNKKDSKTPTEKIASRVEAGLRKASKIKYTMLGDNKFPSQPYQGQVGFGETKA